MREKNYHSRKNNDYHKIAKNSTLVSAILEIKQIFHTDE